MRFRLIPVAHRCDIVLQRKVTPLAPPSQSLDLHMKVLVKPDGIRQMKTIHTEALLGAVQAIRTDDLMQPGIRT